MLTMNAVVTAWPGATSCAVGMNTRPLGIVVTVVALPLTVTRSVRFDNARSPGPRFSRISSYTDDHRLGAGQVLRPGLPEPGLPHPSHAIGSGVVEATPGLDQHVQAHQQPKSVFPACVINDRLVDHQRTALGQCVIGLSDQQPLSLQVPVMQDMPHHQYVSPGQRIGKEVTGMESKPVG